jgi:Patatin-like phospholipase
MSHLTLDDVLRREAYEIHGARLDAQLAGKELYTELQRLGSAALCLSGGGIRSAAFALGVIQAFARHPRDGNLTASTSLLAQFHYVSTVSGGGYIGSWLAALRSSYSFVEIWAGLTGRPDGFEQEAPAIAWLRSYSSYLTPKIGVTSADTWAALALTLRNLLLNWLVIIPPLCAAIVALKIIAILSDWATHLDENDSHLALKIAIAAGTAVAAVLALVAALAQTTRSRPTRQAADTHGPDQAGFLRGPLTLSLLAAVLFVQFLASDVVGLFLVLCGEGHEISSRFLPMCVPGYGAQLSDDAHAFMAVRYSFHAHVLACAALGAFIYALGWIVGRPRRRDVQDFLLWSASGAVFGALIGVGLYFWLSIPLAGIGPFASYVFHLVFGIPYVLLALLAADMIFVGIASYEQNSDADREWLGRAAGWFLVIAILWLVVMFLVFFGAVLTQKALDPQMRQLLKQVVPVIGGVSGLITAVGSRSSAVPAQGEPKGIANYLASAILPVTSALFVASLLLILSYGLDQLLLGRSLVPGLFDAWTEHNGQLPGRPTVLGWLVIGLAIFVALSIVASACININRFSLHALYRNRLTRAFLGAARKRTPDPFTGFDPNDNPPIHRLWAPRDPADWRPFPVLNIALNLVSSSRLSWQERKAEPFTATPLHCGSRRLGYRDSESYGGPNGLTLGTAMAISGAAASPNMGYHSSPAITFMMAMFNVRLGWWLGNPGLPGESSYRHEGPAFALFPLAQEAFGLTTDEKRYVYLSDGGHFENLGLYEMVRRRCRLIVVSDAGCDPQFQFEDLGNAVRKVAIDLGINIRFRGLQFLKPRPPHGEAALEDMPYHATGEIDYGSGCSGIILYIKAGYHGIESTGIRGYANANKDFPHQHTLDQWFTESQFESYRALGFEITDGILTRARAACEGLPTLANILTALHNAK